jgi:hypothetical protein
MKHQGMKLSVLSAWINPFVVIQLLILSLKSFLNTLSHCRITRNNHGFNPIINHFIYQSNAILLPKDIAFNPEAAYLVFPIFMLVNISKTAASKSYFALSVLKY